MFIAIMAWLSGVHQPGSIQQCGRHCQIKWFSQGLSPQRAKTWQFSAAKVAEKLPTGIPRQSWLDYEGKVTPPFSPVNLLIDYVLPFPKKNDKILSIDQTSFPIWTPPWCVHRALWGCAEGMLGMSKVQLLVVNNRWCVKPSEKIGPF